jgi:hypothetical protein
MSTQTAEPKIVVSDAGPALKRIEVTIPADAVDNHIAGAFANLQNGAGLGRHGDPQARDRRHRQAHRR